MTGKTVQGFKFKSRTSSDTEYPPLTYLDVPIRSESNFRPLSRSYRDPGDEDTSRLVGSGRCSRPLPRQTTRHLGTRGKRRGGGPGRIFNRRRSEPNLSNGTATVRLSLGSCGRLISDTASWLLYGATVLRSVSCSEHAGQVEPIVVPRRGHEPKVLHSDVSKASAASTHKAAVAEWRTALRR